MEQELLKRVVIYVHDMCKADQGTIDHFCELLGCSEYDLFNGFENLSQDHGFDLEEDNQ